MPVMNNEGIPIADTEPPPSEFAPDIDTPIAARLVPDVWGVPVTRGLREAVELVDAALIAARRAAPLVSFVDLAGAVRATEGT